MEGRSNVHYPGNTVNIPRPGRKRLKKNWSAKLGIIIPNARRVVHDPKVCATYKCVWCGYIAQPDRPIIICPRCQNCQYCGLHQGAGYNHECVKCGNYLPKLAIDKQII